MVTLLYRRARLLLPASLLLVGILLPLPSHAQSIAGIVRDASGAVMPGVTVEARRVPP